MTTARDIMSKKVITIETTSSVTEIAKIMNKNNISSIVLTEDEKPCGIITERDYLSKIIAQNKKASDLNSTQIVSSPFITVSATTSVDQVAQTMLENKIRHVVVMDKNNPIGIITITDFLKHINAIITDADEYRKDLYESLFEEHEYWDRQ
ncbi:MAG TPA: CBS domain-containing protein [Candidatus Nitrosotalea sp.]|nr:CBS domain-containing protein [Candidatus Nitrosotalea sp.]HEU5487542.1 CBS domain-containing protein [Candidatus Nitrosotalea sp.]